MKNGGHINGNSVCTTAAGGPTDSTSLKCLEEPSFEFEASKETVAKKNTEVKKPSYRVLEDPFETASASINKPKGANYRVLEDPMTTAMYDPSTSSEAMTASRPPASEVLEGAREKFDKFWAGKSKQPQPPAQDNNEP